MQSFSLAIDGNEANVPNRVGSNVYAYEVVLALYDLLRRRDDVRVTILLANPPRPDLPRAHKRWQYVIVKPRPLWTQIGLPIHLFLHRHEYDVLFTPGHYAPRVSAVPYISSVMDLAYLYYPEQFKRNDLLQLTDWTAYSVKRARKVIAISEFTKQDVVKRYGRKASEVVVAYPAVQALTGHTLLTRARAQLRKLKIKQPYLLYVGTLQPRKNVERLIEAFEMLCLQLAGEKMPKTLVSKKGLHDLHPEHLQLVIAGKVGWLADDIVERAKTSPLAKQIILAGYVSDELKQILYEQAAGSVLVGLYEGFGIPALESMQLGTVPVVSNTTSLPEVVGEAGIQVDPEDPKAIAAGLKEVLLMSAKERAQKRKAARQQIEKFTWTKTAQTILRAIEEVAGGQKQKG